MAVSIFHIGLYLDHPSIPVEERPKIEKRLNDLQARMRGAGYNYEIVHASIERGLDDLKHRLKSEPCDGVLLGGGVVGNPEMRPFMDQIVEAVREFAPKAKIMFHDHAEDVSVTVERGLKNGK